MNWSDYTNRHHGLVSHSIVPVSILHKDALQAAETSSPNLSPAKEDMLPNHVGCLQESSSFSGLSGVAHADHGDSVYNGFPVVSENGNSNKYLIYDS